MPEEKNVVDLLREKTEQENLEQYLKRTIGGYTKKSVWEYITVTRKQQTSTAETFHRNLQELYEEKKGLQDQNELLQEKLTKAETELKNLTEAISSLQLESDELTIKDMIALKGKLAASENEIRKLSQIKLALEQETEHLNGSLTEKDLALEKAAQEAQLQKELLRNEKEEAKKQRDRILTLSCAMEESSDEIKYLKGILAEGKTAELTARVEELTTDLSKQGEILTDRNMLLEEQKKAIQTLQQENESMKQSLNSFMESMNIISVQNEKLTLCNQALRKKLEETHQDIINLIEGKSDATVEKLILGRRLDEMKRKLSSLRVEAEKREKADLIHKAADAAEMDAEGF